MIGCVGCYTDDANPEGIHIIGVDSKSGDMTRLSTVRIPNAIYQAISPCGRFLISCEQGGLAAFRIDGGRLEATDRLLLGGRCLCHVSVSADGKTVYWADYLAGEAGSVGFGDGVFIRDRLVRHRHSGSGPNLPRQESAHCHQALPLPDGSGYVVVDLGLDRLSVYPKAVHTVTPHPGAGPRHIAFHPDGRFAFLAYELGNLVSVCRLTDSGHFEFLSSVSTLPAGWSGVSAVAAVRVSEDGTRVFVSNRGHDSIAVFAFDASEGRLELLSVSPVPGKSPRDFLLLPGGQIALATLEASGKVASFSCDTVTGRLAVVGLLDGFYRPSSVIVL